jgi:hypothetical protein
VRWAAQVIRDGEEPEVEDDSGDSGARASRRRIPGPVVQGLLAFIIYLVVFILGFGQALLPHLDVPKVGQTEVDPNFYIWAWRWWTYALTHGLNPLYSHQIGAPGGYNLAWATTSPSTALLMWPVTALFGPIAAFNLTLLLAPPASAWAAFIVARRLTGRFWAALPAGVIFGFNVYELNHEVSGQANLTVTVLIPLTVYLALLWWDGRLKRVGYVCWLAVAFALEFYTFIEAYAELTMAGVAALVIGFALAGKALRPKVLQLALLSAIGYVGGVILAAPYLYFALKDIPKALTRQLPQFSMDLASLVLPRTNRLLGMRWWAAAAGHDLNSNSYLGIPLLVLLVLFVYFGRKKRLTWLLFLTFVVIIALAAGPNLIIDGKQAFALPWGFIWTWPLLKSAEPDRFMDFAYLVLSLVVALWIAELTKSKLLLAARWALATVALAAMLADLPTFAEVVIPPKPTHWVPAVPAGEHPPDALPTFFSDGLYKKYLTQGETVVVLSHRGNAGMLFQAYTNFYFNVAGGFINASLSRPDALPIQIAIISHPTRERADEVRAYVKKDHIGALIVERDYSEHWMYVFGKIGMKAVTVGGVTIFFTGVK